MDVPSQLAQFFVLVFLERLEEAIFRLDRLVGFLLGDDIFVDAEALATGQFLQALVAGPQREVEGGRRRVDRDRVPDAEAIPDGLLEAHRPLAIVITNDPLNTFREACLAAGATHFLDKSLDFAYLLALLSKLADR